MRTSQEGYGFTGMWERAYASDKVAAMKAKAKVQYKGYKTHVVREDGGVSIYVEDRFFADERKHNLESQISTYEDRKAYALKQYEAELARLAAEQEDLIAKLAALQKD